MVAYNMDSDKVFLRCLDTETVEVYELDSLYSAPVKGKNWTHLGISVGPRGSHDALKIGEVEIKGPELQKLMNDLYGSRLIVNREGLCFLAAAGITATTLELEYYRMFDLFDWSKYGVVKKSVSTTWARRDILEGRPLTVTLDDEWKEKLLEKDEKIKRKDDEIKKNNEEIKKKDGLLKEEKDKLNKELDKIRNGLNFVLSSSYFAGLVLLHRSPFPSSKWDLNGYQYETTSFRLTLTEADQRPHLIPLDRKATLAPGKFWFPQAPGKHADKENWYYIDISDTSYGRSHLFYYDGRYEQISEKGYSSLPLPTKLEHLGIFANHVYNIYHILGVGARLCRLW